jgi:hypothetical protein
MVPLLAAVAVNIISVSILLKNNPGLMLGWLQDAKEIRRDMDMSSGLAEALPLLFGICWWAMWRLLEREKELGKVDWVLRVVLGASFLFALFTALIKVARYDLMPGFFGFILVYVVFKYRNAQMSLKKYVQSLGWTLLAIVGLFILFSWLRGDSEYGELLESILGYTSASYNRLPALLEGSLDFPYGGSGTYAFRFLSHIPLLDRVVDVGDFFGMPSSVTVWLSEFSAVHRVGLDGRFIWLSAFGYVYSDLGWFVLPYFMVIGMLSARLWWSILDGKIFGIVLYPWFAFTILFWFGSNFLVYPRLITLTMAALLLSIYEYLLIRSVKRYRVHFGSVSSNGCLRNTIP